MKSVYLASVGAAVMGAVLFIPGLAMAQAEAASDQAQSSDTQAGLTEIVVTAQRREESAQRAGVAITALSAQELQRAAITSATQLTTIAPALQINSTFGPSAGFYMRGVGNFVTNSLSDSAVIVNLDGVPLGRPTGVQGLFFDLDRIEVLKGPQGTLYGRNATGGAVNVITAKPQAGTLSGYANASYGNFNAINLNGAINLPLGDDGAIRVAGQWNKRDGYYSDGQGDDNTKSLRVTLASQLTETFKITVGADFTDMSGRGPGATINGLDRNERIGLFDPRVQAIYASTFNFRAGNTLSPLTAPNFQDNQIWGMYAQAELETGIGTVSLIPSYRRADLHFLSSASGFDILSREKDNQTSVELRLVSDNQSPLSYIVGAFYYNGSDSALQNFNQQFFSAYTSFRPKTTSYAGYARLTYAITPALRVNGGIRYTIDKRSADIFALNAITVCPGSFIPAPAGPQFCFGAPKPPLQLTIPQAYFAPDGTIPPVVPNGNGSILTMNLSDINPSKTFRKATWRVGAEFDVGPRSLLYASYETGYKAGGFFASIDNPVYQPETIAAYTIGSKNRFLNNRLQLNLEGFWWTYKDQQVSHFRANSAGGTEFVTENIGRTRIRGIEVEARAQVTRSTILNTTVQYLDARNLDFVYQNPAIVGLPVTGCPISGPSGGNFTVNCSGLRPVNAPKWTIMGGLEQRISLGSVGDLTFNAQTRYQSSSNTSIDLLPEGVQKGYFQTDLVLTYTAPEDRFTIAAYVNNLEDHNVIGFIQPHPQASGLIAQSLRPPRTYGIRAGLKF